MHDSHAYSSIYVCMYVLDKPVVHSITIVYISLVEYIPGNSSSIYSRDDAYLLTYLLTYILYSSSTLLPAST